MVGCTGMPAGSRNWQGDMPILAGSGSRVQAGTCRLAYTQLPENNSSTLFTTAPDCGARFTSLATRHHCGLRFDTSNISHPLRSGTRNESHPFGISAAFRLTA